MHELTARRKTVITYDHTNFSFRQIIERWATCSMSRITEVGLEKTCLTCLLTTWRDLKRPQFRLGKLWNNTTFNGSMRVKYGVCTDALTFEATYNTESS